MSQQETAVVDQDKKEALAKLKERFGDSTRTGGKGIWFFCKIYI